MTDALSRRRFLRGAAGATLALPLLEATGRRAFGQSAMTPPRRLVVIFHHQGTLLDRWRPSATGAGFDLPPLLADLAPYRDRMMLLSGIDNRVRFEMSGDGHVPAARSILTAMPFSGSLDGAGNLIPGTRGVQNGPAGGPSFEHRIAERIRGEAPYLRLDFKISPGSPGSQILWADRDLPITAMLDPRRAADTVFRNVEPPPEPTPRDRLRAHRRRVLDGVLEQHRQLRARLGAADRRSLDAYAERVSALERTLEQGQSARSCQPLDLGWLPPGYASSRRDDDNLTAQAMNQAIALALGCDLTRVATLQFADGHGPLFPWLNSDIPGRFTEWHAMVHEGRDAYHQDLLSRGFGWYTAMVRHLLDRLDAIPEGDGTVLDHTLVVWLSEFGDGSVHSTTDIPVVMVGNVEGQLRMGRHLAFSGKTTGDLFTSLLNLFGEPATGFGLGRAWDGSPLTSGGLSGLT